MGFAFHHPTDHQSINLGIELGLHIGTRPSIPSSPLKVYLLKLILDVSLSMSQNMII